MEILTSSWVLPVAGPPLRDGRVAVESGRVVGVGRAGEPGVPEGPLRDLGPGVLMPGLVNAHCHVELSHLRGRLDFSHGFVGWVESLVAARAVANPVDVRSAAARAVRALEDCGTVAVGDVSNLLEHVDLLEASRLAAVVFHEVIGWDPAAVGAVLAAAEARLAAVASRPLAGHVEVRLAAHAPHSVSPALFKALAERGGPAALHLAESTAEQRFLATGEGEWPRFLEGRGLGHVAFAPSGLTPVRYVESLGVLHPRLVAAHCVQVDGDDMATLARRQVHVALCPRSNERLGVGLAPAPALLRAGVRLCLGTDSLASVPSLNVLEDAVALHRAFPEIPGEVLVRMATATGAEALGLTHLGTIAPGKRAALVYAPAERAPEEPHGFLLSGEAHLEPVA